jgi:hypothetical protein
MRSRRPFNEQRLARLEEWANRTTEEIQAWADETAETINRHFDRSRELNTIVHALLTRQQEAVAELEEKINTLNAAVFGGPDDSSEIQGDPTNAL